MNMITTKSPGKDTESTGWVVELRLAICLWHKQAEYPVDLHLRVRNKLNVIICTRSIQYKKAMACFISGQSSQGRLGTRYDKLRELESLSSRSCVLLVAFAASKWFLWYWAEWKSKMLQYTVCSNVKSFFWNKWMFCDEMKTFDNQKTVLIRHCPDSLYSTLHQMDRVIHFWMLKTNV